MTRARVFAAPVVVRMILFRMLLFFRRSMAPEFAGRSRTCCDPVAAWTVAMEAVKIFLGPKESMRGFIIWARHVVVQDALEIT